MIKRSIVLHGHATSIRLEPLFWSVLDTIAQEQNRTLPALIAAIDTAVTSVSGGANAPSFSQMPADASQTFFEKPSFSPPSLSPGAFSSGHSVSTTSRGNLASALRLYALSYVLTRCPTWPTLSEIPLFLTQFLNQSTDSDSPDKWL